MERNERILNTAFKFGAGVVGLIIFLMQLGCTRVVENGKKLRLSIPLSSKNGSLSSSSEKLKFVAINLRKSVSDPNPSLAVEMDIDDQIVLPGGTIELVIDKDIPTSAKLFVQYLGVFEGAGSMRFAYGDATVDSSKAGDIVVPINAAMFGSSTKVGRVMGRYFNTASDGPSGILNVMFQPPNSKPAIQVDQTGIYNGWFNVFALESSDVTLSYVIPESGIEIFKNVTLNSGVFDPGGQSHMLKLEKPTVYTYDSDKGEIEQETAETIVVGYFGTGPFSGYNVCYPGVHEAIPYMYVDDGLTSYIEYRGTSGTSADINPTDGGLVVTYGDLMTDVANCDPTSGNHLRIFPHYAGETHEGTIAGINPPFAIVDPFSERGGFVESQFTGSSLILGWTYLQGVTNVSGATVFARPNSMNFEDDLDDDDGCAEAEKYGYKKVKESGGNSALITDVSGTSINSSNFRNWNFIVCPYQTTSSGRKYFPSIARAECIGGCNNNSDHFGWGTSSATIDSGLFTDGGSNLDGAFAKVVDLESNPYDTALTFSDVTGTFTAGAEVMLLVMGTGMAPGCGTFNGETIKTGYYAFTRIMEVSGSTIKIPKTTFADSIPPASVQATDFSPSATYCYLQAIHVPHYKNLTIDTGGLNGTMFDFGNYAGGVMAFRVNGTLTIDGPITISDGGYAGGGYSPSAQFGAGVLGIANNTTATGSGGQGGTSGGGGGGGFGAGGSSAIAAAGGDGYSYIGGYGSHYLVMGGGGGGRSSILGGNGGGILFVAARKIVVGSSGFASLSANGQVASGSGGGGGSVTVLTEKVVNSGSYTFEISAKGADAFTSGDGAGGGGYIKLLACEGSEKVSSLENTAGGVAVSSPMAVDGNTDKINWSGSLPHFCSRIPQ